MCVEYSVLLPCKMHAGSRDDMSNSILSQLALPQALPS